MQVADNLAVALPDKNEIAITVEEYLNKMAYGLDPSYVPSEFSLEFINFIKLVNGEDGEENTSPVIHYKMLDQVVYGGPNVVNMCARGLAKTTLLAEYLFLYIACFGELPKFGDINLALYVSDSIENGIKNMRKNLEFRWENSEFLQKYVPFTKFTDIRWEFHNLEGHVFIVKGYGAKCLSLDTVLFTDTGKTTIGKCKVGDHIYAPNGELTPIILKSTVFTDKPMYQLHLADGRKLKVTDDHINPVVINIDPNNIANWKDTNLTTIELLTQPLIHTKKTNGNPKGISNKSLVFVRNPEPLQYSEKNFPLDPYVLGLLLGDGSLKSDGSCILHGHINDMKFYKKHIGYSLGKPYIDSRNKIVESTAIKGISNIIRELNIVGHGDNKHIPKQYLYGAINQRLELLQGLLDTDGSIQKNGRMDFCSNSKKLVNGVIALVRSLGGIAKRRRVQKAWRTEIWLEMIPFKLPRKRGRYISGKSRQRVAITKITSIAQEASQCIGVANFEHQFLAGDYIRTHNTGVRGTKELGVRPQLAILDDLISDEDARSATVISSIEDTVYKAVNYALHPTRYKIIWSGTPFNARDPLYKAVESGAWAVNVYPICEEFPISKEDFRGAWEDRFTYAYVEAQYDKARRTGKIDTFNQELMLRIMSEEDRMVSDNEIVWYNRDKVLTNKGAYNFYITTDFATSERTAADFSIISVWAYNNNGDWLWVDGICKKQLMDKNINDLFRLTQEYNPQAVGIEISGQQKGFIPWIQGEMGVRNCYFTLAQEKNSTELGLRPNTKKIERFNVVLPLFKLHKIWFPTEMRNGECMIEAMDELRLLAKGAIKSKHDDFLDTISMLGMLTAWKPSQVTPNAGTHDKYWDDWEKTEDNAALESYLP